jgi:hypothetical protein
MALPVCAECKGELETRQIQVLRVFWRGGVRRVKAYCDKCWQGVSKLGVASKRAAVKPRKQEA